MGSCCMDCHLILEFLTPNKSFTRSCLWRFGVKLRRSIHAVPGVPLSSSRLEESLLNSGSQSSLARDPLVNVIGVSGPTE